MKNKTPSATFKSSSLFGPRRSVRRLFLLRHDKKLAPVSFFHRNLPYFIGFFNLSNNASVSIRDSQPYSSIEIHTALNRRIFKLSWTFGDINIDLNLVNELGYPYCRILWQNLLTYLFEFVCTGVLKSVSKLRSGVSNERKN